MFDHHTIHLFRREALDEVDELMLLLGFIEVPADDPFEHGYAVRWFAPMTRVKPWIHFVYEEGPTRGDKLDLGHFCVAVSRERFKHAAASRFCERNSGSGRIWLRHDACRVEVRPS